MASDFEFFTTWHLDAPLARVWDTLYDALGWPVWWEGLVAVVQVEPGKERGIGSLQRYTWKGRLPYRLTFDIRVTRVERPNLIEGVASGDVEGVGRWLVSGRGTTTTVAYVWQIRTTKRWMKLLAPLARPLFRWNHNQVMRRGGIGLARFLDARLLEMTFT
jgi:hypothetical protein